MALKFLEKHRAEVAERKAAEAQRNADIRQARAIAARLPDSDGVVSPEGFREFFQFVLDHNLDVRLLADEWQAINIGLAQGGFFIPTTDSTLLLKKDESALHECDAQLLKEVADREFRGGSRGVSIPVGHSGVRLRAGGFRGHMVTVGTHVEIADTGRLTITDQRVVYHGSRKTLEFPYSKLASVNLYSDAIELGVTSRQRTSTLRVVNPELIAGLIHGAFSHHDDGVTLIHVQGTDD